MTFMTLFLHVNICQVTIAFMTNCDGRRRMAIWLSRTLSCLTNTEWV